MHDRTKKINKAIKVAKERDGYTCLLCGKSKERGHQVDGAHLASRNGSHGIDPTDHNLIITLCRRCHREYDSNNILDTRPAYLRKKGLRRFAENLEEAMRPDKKYSKNDVHVENELFGRATFHLVKNK